METSDAGLRAGVIVAATLPTAEEIRCATCRRPALDVPDAYELVPRAAHGIPLPNESAHLLWTCTRGHGNVTRATRRGPTWHIETVVA